MPKLPAGLEEYKRTSEFTDTTVPEGLTKTHTLKEGTWGELVVLEGHVRYVLEDRGGAVVVLRRSCGASSRRRPRTTWSPAPGARFFVRFLRQKGV
jgi:tellurite resistance-related uncharacterized protein